ncbi:MAG: 50S ribosomal protein L3 N(5)-glutamine methyltransferase [Methylococcales bacterium]|nr:50S ribosomal protein L3 N(5)-glutamine methyltransferase [Methylococcales bacterium]
MNNQSPEQAGLVSVLDYVRWAVSRFNAEGLSYGQGTNNALDDAAALVLKTLYLPYNLAIDYWQGALTTSERQAVSAVIEQRIDSRLPVAYLTHESVFAGLEFYVDQRVLIPRSPIAELIQEQFAPWLDSERVTRILDLCTGSGCIAIAAAHYFANARVDAVDVSEQALQVAEINRQKHGLEQDVNLIQSDLFQALPDDRYDLIVSNPPYVAEAVWQALPEEFKHEPALGFKGGEDGLDLVLRILHEAPRYLAEHGVLVVEVGASARTLQRRFPQVPFHWLEFEHGGDGVFLLTAEQLATYHDYF